MSRSEQRRRDRGQGGGPAGSSPTPVSREVDGRPAKMHDDDGCGSISSLNPRQQRALKTSLASLQGDALTYIILSFIGALSGGVAMRLLDLLEHIIREAFNLNDDDVTKEAIQEMEDKLTQSQRRFYDQVIGQVMDLKFEIDGEANSEQLSDELGSLREMLTSGRPTPMNHDPRSNGQRGRGQNRRSQEADYDEDQGGDEEEEYYEEPPRPTRGQQRPQQRPQPQPQGRQQNRPQPRGNGRPQRAGFPAPRRQAGYDPNYDEGFDRYGGQTQEVNIDEMSKVELKNSLLVVLQNNRKLSSQKGMMSALFFVGWIVTMFFQTPITRGLYYAYDGTVNWVYSFGYEDLMHKQQRREQLALEEKKARQATAGSFESVVTAKTAEERENARMKYDEALLSSIGIFNDARKARDEHDAIIKRFTPQPPAAPVETATPTVTKPAEAAPQPAAPAPAVIPPAAETPAEGEKKSE